MKTIAIIPARYSSTRFPGKPLIDIRGKTMIQRTYEQALKVKNLDYITVATDDERIETKVKSFNGNVIMTSSDHPSGTDRCLEAAEKIASTLSLQDNDVILNVQGDEPYIHPESLTLIIECFKKNPDANIVTLYKPIVSEKDLFDIGTAKVVLNHKKEIMYFSRSPIPCIRDLPQSEWKSTNTHHKQIGVYGYRFGTLKKIARLEQTPLEKAEKLEQLRWLENGYAIMGQETPHESFSIDFPDDLKKVDLLTPEK